MSFFRAVIYLLMQRRIDLYIAYRGMAGSQLKIGLFKRQHLDYLKQHRRVTYTNLLTSGRLGVYLAEIDRQAQERSHRLIKGMKQAQA